MLFKKISAFFDRIAFLVCESFLGWYIENGDGGGEGVKLSINVGCLATNVGCLATKFLAVILLDGDEEVDDVEEEDDDNILEVVGSFLIVIIGSDKGREGIEGGGGGGGANWGGGGTGWSGEEGVDIGSKLILDNVGDGVVVVAAEKGSSCWNESGKGFSDWISRWACEIWRRKAPRVKNL